VLDFNIKALEANLDFDCHSLFQVAARQIQPPHGRRRTAGIQHRPAARGELI
jgi:hypothetical protein